MQTDILYAQLSAHPLRASEQQTRAASSRDELIRLLNERILPPTPLTFDDVHIRALRLVSDEVNDHGGRFPLEEHDRLCALIIDSPVLIGHDHQSIPVARNFAARCMNEGERSWVEVWFYWMRGEGPHQDQLAADIDAGIVKEGSIAFEFRTPQCSICNQDMRTCEHIPDFEYDGQIAHYEYRDIERVLETSLVYRGATPDTRIVKYPLFAKLERAQHGCAATETVAARPRRAHAEPPTRLALLQDRLAVRRNTQPRFCPSRTVPWPRYLLQYRAGHGPLTSMGGRGSCRAACARGKR